jgi:hypothetical protein
MVSSPAPVGWRKNFVGFQFHTAMGVHTFSRLGTSQVPMICRKIQKAHSFGIFYGANPLDYTFTLVLLEIIFVLLTSRVIRFLLKPLKQPRIVSDIIVSFLFCSRFFDNIYLTLLISHSSFVSG